MATLEPGKQAPDFSLNTLDGKKFSLRDAAERGPVFALTGLLWTLRTNTNEGFLRSSVAEVADEAEAAGACCRVVGSEKSILPKAYGPALPAAGAFAGPGGRPMDG